MAIPADNFDTVDLKAALKGGLVSEDVMDRIWDISRIPLPFTDLIGSGTSTNSFTEWTQDSLAAVDLTNAIISGDNATGNQAAAGTRVGNHHQISDKVVNVTVRANTTKQFGRTNELAYQLMMRQQELKRDIEGISLNPQASIADDNDTVAGKVGTFPAWLETNALRGTGGTDGGFNTTTGVVDKPGAGEGRALTETFIRTSLETVFQEGGNVSTLMTTPPLVAGLSFRLFASTGVAQIRNTEGDESGARTAVAAVNVYVSDFDTVFIVPNRLQQTYNSTDSVPVPVVDVFFIDPELVEHTFLQRPITEMLAKTGLAENRQMHADWSLRVLNEKGHAVISDILPGTAVTA